MICVCFAAVAFVARPAFHDRDFGRQAVGISLALLQVRVDCTASICPHKPRAASERSWIRPADVPSHVCVQSLVAAAAKLLVRELRTTESPYLIVLALSSFTMLLSATAVTSTTGWHGTAKPWLLLLAVGVFGFFTQTAITLALRYAAAAPAVAMSYLSVVSGLASGYAVFGEVPSVSTAIGGALICLSTLSLAIYER